MNSESLTRGNQLEWIVGVLTKNSVQYWLDSGSLLGIVREHSLLAHDNDIDISILKEHEFNFLGSMKDLERGGFRVFRYSYRGSIFKYKLIDVLKRGLRPVDINMFSTEGIHLWCPQPRAINLLGMKKAFLGPLIKITERLSSRLEYASFPLSSRGMYTWFIPIELVLPTTKYGNTTLLVPKMTEKYLEFRYGNWHVPKQDWSFWHDDGGLNKARPEELVDLRIKRRKKA